MSTYKSPLYLPWLLIICVSDEIVVTSQVYKFHSNIVVMSQSINKNFWVSHPLLLCLPTRKFPTLLKQLWQRQLLVSNLANTYLQSSAIYNPQSFKTFNYNFIDRLVS
jgi:hypothetical protein